MLENKMKTYLGENYSENKIKNFLKYWQMPSKPRKTTDLDCIYLNGDLNADTLISFWTPLKWVLQILHPKQKFYKIVRDGKDPYRYLKELENNLSGFLPQNDELVKLIYKLASLAETRANIIRLPEREMNVLRYRYFYDEVPPTLYHAFKGGHFHRYFGSDEAVLEWICEQKLQPAFYNNEPSKENIRPLLTNLPLGEAKWPKTREEVTIILKEMICLLEARYRLLDEDEVFA